jgi:chromosome segregation ATPase
MAGGSPLRTIKQLMGQTPLIIDPDRDAPSFQTALSALSTEKLQSFYRDLSAEDRRRFHYVANVCLGFESWSRLYQELVVHETQTRLSERLEEAYAQKTEAVRRREEELHTERGGLQEELMRLDRENLSLHRENQILKKELADLQQTFLTVQRQQQQLLELVERYQGLLREFKNFMSPASTQPDSKELTP